MQSFGTLGQFLKLPPCSPKYSIVRGVPPILFLIGILIFLWVRSLCKNLEPYNNPFWDFNNGGESKSEKILITKNSGLPKLLRWSHELRSNQCSENFSRPIFCYLGLHAKFHSIFQFHFKISCLQDLSKLCLYILIIFDQPLMKLMHIIHKLPICEP